MWGIQIKIVSQCRCFVGATWSISWILALSRPRSIWFPSTLGGVYFWAQTVHIFIPRLDLHYPLPPSCTFVCNFNTYSTSSSPLSYQIMLSLFPSSFSTSWANSHLPASCPNSSPKLPAHLSPAPLTPPPNIFSHSPYPICPKGKPFSTVMEHVWHG